MERLLYRELLKWKNKPNRKPLILNGARQVGKTWLLREFGKREYRNMAYVNCEKVENMDEVFMNFDTRRMVMALSAVTGEGIVPGETLVFLDEIQEYPRALNALKYFCEDAPEYHVVVAGSLLGISLHQGVSFPVGKVEMMHLYPMTFTEFVLAKGNVQTASLLRDGDLEETNSLHTFLMDYLRQYYYTGGMPAAVQAFVGSGNLKEVRGIQQQILSDYRRDFSKHVSHQEAERIAMVWNSIPRQLAKKNKKFMYSEVKAGGRAGEYLLPLQWLEDAGLDYKVLRVNSPQMPLRFYEEQTVFKLFLNDVGLLGALMDVPAKDVILGDNAFVEYKGAFTELYVLSQLKPLGLVVRYFSTNNSTIELDFVVQTAQGIVPVEVKAEENVRSKSLRIFAEKHPQLKAVRFSMKPYLDQGWMVNVPLYSVEGYFRKNCS